MHFDFLSFLIGFGVAAVIGFVLYSFRNQIAAARQTAEGQAGATRQFITNSSEVRYSNDLIKTLNAYHIAGEAARLTDLYVEPQFIRPFEPVDPSAEAQRSIFQVIPIIHDMPASYASYNIDTLSLNDLREGETHIALLGLPGSGKSTTLALLGLMAADEIEIEAIDMMSDEVFEDETKNLPPDEKEKLIKQRQETQKRAIAHLKQAQAKDEETAEHVPVDFKQLMPILVHMRDIDLRPEAYGVATASANGKSAKVAMKALDPAEPIVKALQHRTSIITARTLPRMVYNRLTEGTCMVLIDGYEEIPLADRPEKLLWLGNFMQVYPQNFIVVTGPAEGFDPLINLGLAPVFLRAWTDTDYERMVQRWAAAWPAIGGTAKKPAPMPDERTLRRVLTNNRGRTPLDVALKAWAAFAGDEQEAGRRGWYDFYVRQHLNAKDARSLVEHFAVEILNQDGAPLSRDRMKEIIAATNTSADGKTTVNADDLLNKITGSSGLLVDWPGNAYGFTHPLLNAYLAGEALENAGSTALSEAVANPTWDAALAFASAKIPMADAVTQRLGSAPDLLYTSLFSLVSWLPDAPPNAPWRAEVFKRLTAALLAPSQYPSIRERAMAALVESRDKNVLFIFRQALRSTDPAVRRLGCVGLGAVGDPEAIKDLGPMLTDSDAQVQLTAGMALGAIGTEAALETMLSGFINGEQALRQAVAEALAAVPGEGHAVLRDAIASQDMMVRRAAVFGLSRVKAAWALSLLYRALLEDEQWYVRNAAEQAFQQAQGLESGGAMLHPEADGLSWLVSWAAQKGEGVPAGQNARQVLIRVLQEGDPVSKAAAALSLANLGHMPAIKPLYGALRDRDDKVRAAVYEALSELQTRVGEKFPAVV